MKTLRPLGKTRWVPEATADTLDLVGAAQRGAWRIWRDGFRYAKTGIIMDDLVPAGTAQRPLSDARDRVRSDALMNAMDAVNARFGRGTIVPAAAGILKEWQTKFGMRSPRYTTRVAESFACRPCDGSLRALLEGRRPVDGIAKLLVAGGAVGLAGAGLWWHETYSRIAEFLGARDLPTECLWTMGGACGAVSSAANLVGANAYDPRLFWGSAACLVVGAILLVIPSGSGHDDVYLTRKRDRDYRPPEPDDRRDPYL